MNIQSIISGAREDYRLKFQAMACGGTWNAYWSGRGYMILQAGSCAAEGMPVVVENVHAMSADRMAINLCDDVRTREIYA